MKLLVTLYIIKLLGRMNIFQLAICNAKGQYHKTSRENQGNYREYPLLHRVPYTDNVAKPG